jgi:hypothetical protein
MDGTAEKCEAAPQLTGSSHEQENHSRGHDSGTEEHFLRVSGCDLDHFKCLNWHVGALALDKIGKREDNFVTC